MGCVLCPHECNVDRVGKLGACQAPAGLEVASDQLHFWEEPCLSGARGSGTVFFSHCNLRCLFCQNYVISQAGHGRTVGIRELCRVFLKLQKQGAHNINLVSPTPYTGLLIDALRYVRRRLTVPVVWNSNAYEKVETLKKLEGLVQIYLPDLKYRSEELAREFSAAPGYFGFATAAILEMRRQTGTDRIAPDGIMERGLLVRHLVLPGQAEDTKAILRWIRENLGKYTLVSLMAQYHPVHKARAHPTLGRHLTREEYAAARAYFVDLGFDNGYVQGLSSATPFYTPDFRRE